jgi:hypothetical protein
MKKSDQIRSKDYTSFKSNFFYTDDTSSSEYPEKGDYWRDHFLSFSKDEVFKEWSEGNFFEAFSSSEECTSYDQLLSVDYEGQTWWVPQLGEPKAVSFSDLEDNKHYADLLTEEIWTGKELKDYFEAYLAEDYLSDCREKVTLVRHAVSKGEYEVHGDWVQVSRKEEDCLLLLEDDRHELDRDDLYF